MKEIFTMSDFDQVLKSAGDKLVVVDFAAEWCGPCRVIGPQFKKMSSEDKYQKVVFCKVDVDEASDVAEHYEVEAMPAFMFFRNGKTVKVILGANTEKIEQAIQELL